MYEHMTSLSVKFLTTERAWIINYISTYIKTILLFTFHEYIYVVHTNALQNSL